MLGSTDHDKQCWLKIQIIHRFNSLVMLHAIPKRKLYSDRFYLLQ